MINNYTNKNIKYLREKNNLSQLELSNKLNIDQSTLAKWENNSRQITLEWAIKISKHFHIDVGSFIQFDLSELESNNLVDLKLVNKYKNLSTKDKELVINIIDTRLKQKEDSEGN